MSLDKLQSAFSSRIGEVMKTYKQGIVKPLGSNVLCEFTLGSDTQNFITGADRVMDQMSSLVSDANKDQATAFFGSFSTKDHWEKVITKANKKIIRDKQINLLGRRKSVKINTYAAQKRGLPPAGIYFGRPMAGMTLKIHLLIWASNTNKIDRQIINIWEAWTEQIWNAWVASSFGKTVPQGQQIFDLNSPTKGTALTAETEIRRMSTSGGVMRQQAAITAFRTSLKKEHDPTTTEAKFAIEDLKAAGGDISAAGHSIKLLDIVKHIEEGIRADWNQKTSKVSFGNYKLSNYVKINMGPNPPNLDADLGNIKDKANEFILKELEKTVYKPTHRDPLNDPKFTASKPIADQVAEDVINDIVNSIVKHKSVKKKKQKAKKFIAKPRSGNLKRGTNSNAKVKSKNLKSKKGRKLKTVSGQESGQGTEASAIDLQKVRVKINRKLPAALRRNMGQSGRLTNRTGRFADSVKILNLRETAAGISGEWTYMKFPYQTFEEGFAQGKRRWDPRPLVNITTREIAIKEKLARFTQLRRV